MTLEELKTQVSMIYSAQNLESAVGMLQTILNSVGTSPLIQTNVNSNVPVIYGKDGYTDANDPRTIAARNHLRDNNSNLIAVWCGVVVQPESTYRCVLVDVLPKDQSCNIYCEVYDKNGNPASVNNVRQLTGWRQSATDFDNLYDAPQSPGKFSMGHDGKFWLPNLGPYGVCVTDGNGKIISDIAGSFGLPDGTHCSYRVCFRER